MEKKKTCVLGDGDACRAFLGVQRLCPTRRAGSAPSAGRWAAFQPHHAGSSPAVPLGWANSAAASAASVMQFLGEHAWMWWVVGL